MSKIAQQSIQTTIFSYIGVLLGYINVLWLYPYALDATELGTFRTIQDLGLLFVPFAQLGVGHGITRFFPKLEQNQSAFLSYSLALSLLGFSAVTLIFFGFKSQIMGLFATNSPEVLNFLGVVLLITLFALLSSVMDAYSRSYLKIAIPTFFREVFLRLLTSVLVGVYLLGWINFDEVMLGLVVVYGMALLGVLAYLIWLGKVHIDFNWKNFPPGFRSSFIRFSLITFLATAASTLIMKIDSIMVSSMVSLEANAIYSIAFYMALVVELPRRAISQVAMPVIADHFAKDQIGEINKLYRQISNRQLYICLLLFALIWSNIDSIYHYVPNREIYQAGKYVVFYIALGKIFDVAFSVNSEILVFSKYYRFNLVLTIAMSILIIGVNYWLIPIYGIEGAAIGSASVMLAFNLVKYGYLKIKLQLDPFSYETLKILFVGVMIFALRDFYLDGVQPLLMAGIKSILIVGMFFFWSMIANVGQDEWNWLKSKLKKSGS
ncbi:lipopolysaccharide biosynthesis protein [Algoriphagus sp.]|uniref:lipopolysaccharide biosynthesis protein n=1 Tax=Algoriphagus sp. TaxID=1872435 RepID=UPI002715941B|nr:polysaccharide biosynthesis C-terminal domain-containing protein [Algoriphagus sp.]MDO8967286.1 polysaccharide biosynthesis C-terminal domain-containing protein [Algoriphagus sp.]MDP3199614.1 polysaccharide biosynthesis C-terminal domain-containing protein [Algoriphagus sp.]